MVTKFMNADDDADDDDSNPGVDTIFDVTDDKREAAPRDCTFKAACGEVI